MRKFIILIISILVTAHVFAQKREYEGKYLGWIKMFNPTEPQKPYKVDHRNYSVKQMTTSQLLVSWMQQSYTPKGALGQAFKLVNPALGLYNQETKAQPQNYGTTTKTLIELKKNAQGKWIPESNTNWFAEIAVNGSLGDYSDAITTPEQYYFYIPGETGLGEDEKKVAALRGFDNHSALKKYISWYQPKGIRTTLQYVVLLCRDNVKPYVRVTKGEYLAALERAIEKDAQKKYKWIAEEKAKSSSYDASATEAQLQKRKAALARFKEKYKNRLNEPASQKEQSDINLENYSEYDLFEGNQYSRLFPVYKFDSLKLALTKSDTPQWIVIRWDAEGVATGNEAGAHLHQSMLDNIDYDYIYNYFFYPEKVKGIAYKPLKSPAFEEKIVATPKSESAIKNEANADVLFFEDFSTTPENRPPTGWNSTLNLSAQKATIKKLAGDDGNWVQLKGHRFHENKISKPLPSNFTVTFDVCVKKDFHWGTPGLEFYLAGKKKYENSYENYIMVKVRPGFNDRDGWATVNIIAGGKSIVPGEVAVPGFSNDKPLNRTTVTIKRTGEQVQVFVGNTRVFDNNKAIPPGTLLEHLYFSEFDQQWEVEEFYVTNIKVLKN